MAGDLSSGKRGWGPLEGSRDPTSSKRPRLLNPSIISEGSNTSATRSKSAGALESVSGLDLFSYFCKHLTANSSQADIDRLIFSDPVACLALFRSFGPVSKVVVTRLLMLPDSARWEAFAVWLRGNRRETTQAIQALRSFHVLTAISMASNPSGDRADSVTAGGTDSGVGGSSTAGAASSSRVSLNSAASQNRSVPGAGAGGNTVRYALNSAFRETLEKSTWEGTLKSHVTGSEAIRGAKNFPTKSTLQSYAAAQWTWLLQSLCDRVSYDNRLIRNVSVINQGGAPPKAPSGDLLAVLTRLKVIQPNAVFSTPINVPEQRPTESLGGEDTRHTGELSNETFQWLLLDIRMQILSICLQFMECLYDGSLDTGGTVRSPPVSMTGPAANLLQQPKYNPTARLEVLQLLFILAEALIGQPCSALALTSAQKRFLLIAAEIGLIWVAPAKRTVKYFFPTPFTRLLQSDNQETSHLTSVISTLTALGSESAENPLAHSLHLNRAHYHAAYDRFFAAEETADFPPPLMNTGAPTETAAESGVIVESNFRVFAFTGSALLVAVVGRLCEKRVITPCLWVAALTRATILEAYKCGVTADQVIRFFTAHAHPSIYSKSRRENKPVLPENVATQLKIWEAERRRVRLSRAVVFQFTKESDLPAFVPAVLKASQAGWLISHTDLPASSRPESPEYTQWFQATLERMRVRVTGVGESGQSSAPVLAVHAKYKDEASAFLRTAIRRQGLLQGAAASGVPATTPAKEL